MPQSECISQEQFRITCRKLTPTDALLTTGLVVAIQWSAAASGNRLPRLLRCGPAGSGDCTAEPGEVPDERAPGHGHGLLRCYRDANGYGVFAWTAPEQAIVASAADPDRSFAELFRW
jgi:hypothetical protein